MILSNVFMAYKLRDMQNIGTSWKLLVVLLVAWVLALTLNLVATGAYQCVNHGMQAAGFCVFLAI